jgi:hypothetical protein
MLDRSILVGARAGRAIPSTAVAASPMSFLHRIGVLQKIGSAIVAVYSTGGRRWAPAQGFYFVAADS